MKTGAMDVLVWLYSRAVTVAIDVNSTIITYSNNGWALVETVTELLDCHHDDVNGP